METMNGLQLLLLMKLQAPATKFVIVSDVPGEEARAQAYQNGADFYLLRPHTSAAVRNGLQNVMMILDRDGGNHSPGVEEPVQRLTDLVQTRCLSGDSVILVVRSHFQSGDIFIYRGEVFHAQYPGKSGPLAFHDMIHWDDGLVRVSTFPLTNIPPRTIETSYRVLVDGMKDEIPFASDLRPPHEEAAGAREHTVDHAEATSEAPALPEEPASRCLPDLAKAGIETLAVGSYWKVNLMGELVEGSGVTDPDHCAFITNFLYRKMADVAVALEVDYFDTLTLLGPDQQQVLVADNLGIAHAVFESGGTEEARGQFVNWCREQSL
jgi:hypothetical protein